MVTRQRIFSVGYVALWFVTGCSSVAGEWNSLRTLRAQQAIEHKSAELSRFLENIQRIELEIEAAGQRSRKLEIELAGQREVGRSKSRELAQRQTLLRALEEDLEVASERSHKIKAGLAGLQAMEQRYAERDKLLAELSAKMDSLEKSLVPLQAAVASKEAEIKTRVAALRGRLDELRAFAKQLAEVLAAAKVVIPDLSGPAAAAQGQKGTGTKKDAR